MHAIDVLDVILVPLQDGDCVWDVFLFHVQSSTALQLVQCNIKTIRICPSRVFTARRAA